MIKVEDHTVIKPKQVTVPKLGEKRPYQSSLDDTTVAREGHNTTIRKEEVDSIARLYGMSPLPVTKPNKKLGQSKRK